MTSFLRQLAEIFSRKDVKQLAHSKGYTIGPVYHGSPNEKFNVFDPEKRGQSTGAKDAEKAFFFSSHPTVAEFSRAGGDVRVLTPKGKQMEKMIIDKINQLLPKGSFEDTKKLRFLYDLEKEGLITSDQYREIGHWKSRYFDLYNQKEYTELLKSGHVQSNYLMIKDPFTIDFRGSAWNEQKQNKAIFNAIQDDNDGVIFLNIGEGDGTISTTYAVFKPNQIKSAESVTMDDQNNPIPLEQRFDPNNSDVRY